MHLAYAERIAEPAASKPEALRHQAYAWARTKARDLKTPADLRVRAAAVARTLHADMAERDRRALAAFSSREACR